MIRWRWAALWVAAAVFIGLMVLSPTSDTPNGWLHRWCDWLSARGVPDRLTGFGAWEVVANVALFVPLGFLGRGALPLVRFWWWFPLGLLGGACVETFQGLVFDMRDASLRDVLANAVGTGLGATVFEALALAMPAGGLKRMGAQYLSK